MKEVWNRPRYQESRSGETHPMYGRDRSGDKNPMYNKRHTEETKRKIGDKNKGEKNAMWGRFGEEHPSWKDNNVGVKGIHLRAHKADPKPEDGKCSYCYKVKDKFENTKLVHSNKDHSYRLPINPDDWWLVHKSCHEKYDNENNNSRRGTRNI